LSLRAGADRFWPTTFYSFFSLSCLRANSFFLSMRAAFLTSIFLALASLSLCRFISRRRSFSFLRRSVFSRSAYSSFFMNSDFSRAVIVTPPFWFSFSLRASSAFNLSINLAFCCFLLSLARVRGLSSPLELSSELPSLEELESLEESSLFASSVGGFAFDLSGEALVGEGSIF